MAFQVNQTNSGVFVRGTCEGCGVTVVIKRPTEQHALIRFSSSGWVTKDGKVYHSQECFEKQRVTV